MLDRAALKWMHLCGYVHRDISVGNILLYEGRGLLMDLEYSKQVDQELPVHEPVTVRSVYHNSSYQDSR